MPRLVYLTGALRNLDKITYDIELVSQSTETALKFINRLTDYCEHFAKPAWFAGKGSPRASIRVSQHQVQ